MVVHNAGPMGTDGSARGVGPVAGVALLLLGFAAMQGVALLAMPLGMRPMFLLAETALVLPGLLYLLVRGLPLAPTLGLFPSDRRLTLLRRAGTYDGPETGVFEDSTVAAVREFQRSRYLPPDGWLGPITRIALYAAAGGYQRPVLTATGGTS